MVGLGQRLMEPLDLVNVRNGARSSGVATNL